MQSALIALLSAILVVSVTEFFRRRSRIEHYAAPIFEKRLAIYGELFRRVQKASIVGERILGNPSLTHEQRRELVWEAVLEIADFCDEQAMYIREEIAVHCIALLMGVEDIAEHPDHSQRALRTDRFRNDVRLTRRIIREESGLSEIDALFRSITAKRPSSPIIEYYRAAMNRRGMRVE